MMRCIAPKPAVATRHRRPDTPPARSVVARCEDIEKDVRQKADDEGNEQHSAQGPANAQPEHDEGEWGEEDERHFPQS